MRKSLRSKLAVLVFLVALVAGCGGSTGSGSAGPGPAGGTVDAQLRDDANWQVVQTADQ